MQEKRSRISGTGFVSWRTAKENLAAPGVLILEAPDRMRLEVQDPVGGVHALLILNRDRFFWYGSEEPNNWIGPVRKLQKVTSVSLSGPYLIRALTGAPKPDGFSGGSGTWKKSGTNVSESVEEGAGGDLRQWSAESTKGSWRVVSSYENFSVRFGVSVPQLIKVELFERGKLKSRFTWKWSDLRLEGAANDSLLQIPTGEVLGKPTRPLQ